MPRLYFSAKSNSTSRRPEAEHMIQPYRVADDLRGEPMAVAGVGWRFHAASFARPRTADQSRLP